MDKRDDLRQLPMIPGSPIVAVGTLENDERRIPTLDEIREGVRAAARAEAGLRERAIDALYERDVRGE